MNEMKKNQNDRLTTSYKYNLVIQENEWLEEERCFEVPPDIMSEVHEETSFPAVSSACFQLHQSINHVQLFTFIHVNYF